MNFFFPLLSRKYRDELSSPGSFNGLTSPTSILIAKTFPPDHFDTGRHSIYGETTKTAAINTAQDEDQVKQDHDRDQPQDKTDEFPRLFVSTLQFHWSQFFGLPNRIRRHNVPKPVYPSQIEKPHHIINAKLILKNLVGWHDDNSPEYQKWLNRSLIKPLLILCWNVIVIIPFKFIRNLIKVFTELLPGILDSITQQAFMHCLNEFKRYTFSANQKMDSLIKLGWGLAVGVFFLMNTVFRCCYFIGCAITSPLNNIRRMWYLSQKEIPGPLGKVVGVLLAILSAAITLAIYTILLPLAIHAVITQAPAAISAIASGIAKAVNATPGVTAVSASGDAALLATGAAVLPVALAIDSTLRNGSDWWYEQTDTPTPTAYHAVAQKDDDALDDDDEPSSPNTYRGVGSQLNSATPPSSPEPEQTQQHSSLFGCFYNCWKSFKHTPSMAHLVLEEDHGKSNSSVAGGSPSPSHSNTTD